MSNIFRQGTYGENHTDYIQPQFYSGVVNRADTFMEASDDTVPYGKPYKDPNEIPFSGLANRTTANMLDTVMPYKIGYYGHAVPGATGIIGYDDVYDNHLTETVIHLLQFKITNAFQGPQGTVRVATQRESGDYSADYGLDPFSYNSHGMGNATTKYTDTYSRKFRFNGFQTGAGDWGDVLNWLDNTNISLFVEVIDGEHLDIWYDDDFQNPIDASTWDPYNPPFIPYATIAPTGQIGSWQVIQTKTFDSGNRSYTTYDADFLSGVGNAQNGEFGRYLPAANTGDYVGIDSLLNPVQAYYNNPIVAPGINHIVSGTSPGYGTITGHVFDDTLCGLFPSGGTAGLPFNFGHKCALLAVAVPGDPTPIAGTVDGPATIAAGNPTIATFPTSVRALDPTKKYTWIDTTNGISSEEVEGVAVYFQSDSHNTARVYLDKALTIPLNKDVTGGIFGNMIEIGDNDGFGPGKGTGDFNDVFNPQELQTDDLLGTADQIWPSVATPAKAELKLIQPSRSSYAQDLTRYTVSTAAHGYRISLQYNNISKADWKIYDNFIKSMRGAYGQFRFSQSTFWNIWGGNSAQSANWGQATVAALASPGDSKVYFYNMPTQTPVLLKGDLLNSLHTYTNKTSFNNVAFSGSDARTNDFGEVAVRLTHPMKNTVTQGTSIITGNLNTLTCQMTGDEIEYNWHPTGNFVSFGVEFDVV